MVEVRNFQIHVQIVYAISVVINFVYRLGSDVKGLEPNFFSCVYPKCSDKTLGLVQIEFGTLNWSQLRNVHDFLTVVI